MLKLNIVGHLGKDCTNNQVNGKNVINFSVAHSEKFKDNTGQPKEKTIWVDCAYWTDRTAIAPYLKKGQLIYAEGVPDLKNYTKNDGTPGSSMTLRVLGIQLLGSSVKSETANGDITQTNEGIETSGSDDLPF